MHLLEAWHQFSYSDQAYEENQQSLLMLPSLHPVQTCFLSQLFKAPTEKMYQFVIVDDLYRLGFSLRKILRTLLQSVLHHIAFLKQEGKNIYNSNYKYTCY